MAEQALALQRCASCDRWRGPRRVGATAQSVDIDGELVTGLCVGGPWDGSERRARSACGRWIVWLALAAPAGAE